MTQSYLCYLSVSSTLPSFDSPPDMSNSNWSKEAMFALLSVLFVVLVPCIGLLLRLCLIKWRPQTALHGTRKVGGGYVSSLPQKLIKLPRGR
jgi:hypothetical protein